MTIEYPTPVAMALAELNVPFTQFVHPGPVFSLEQAAEERDQRPEQVVRSILFRLAEDDYLMVLVGGPQQVDWKALRKATGRSRLTMASPEEVLTATGYEIGAVGPFGLPSPIPVIIDQSVMDEDVVSIGSGVRSTTIIMTSADLKAALGDVEVVSVSKN